MFAAVVSAELGASAFLSAPAAGGASPPASSVVSLMTMTSPAVGAWATVLLATSADTASTMLNCCADSNSAANDGVDSDESELSAASFCESCRISSSAVTSDSFGDLCPVVDGPWPAGTACMTGSAGGWAVSTSAIAVLPAPVSSGLTAAIDASPPAALCSA